MRITHVEVYPVRVPLVPQRRMLSALGRHEVSDYVLVRVLTDDGIEGAGEATVMPRWSGETMWGAAALLEQMFGPAVIGCDPSDIHEINRRLDALAVGNPFAKAAIEMACWDIRGRAAGRPVFELLGGACRDRRFRCRFSLGAYEPARAAEIAAERVVAGFTTIKVKVGGAASDDIARVRAVRAAVGSQVELVVDANGGWDTETAIAALAELSDCRLSLVEQPTPREDYTGLARVRAACGLLILADESCFELGQARELVAHSACDAITVYPGKNAGIEKSRAIVEFAAAHGVPCTIGSNLELDVATAAMAHLVVACPNIAVERIPGDALGPAYHEFSIAKNPLLIEGPWVTAPSGPGLGVDVDWALVRRSAP
ncbi:MAG: hypothetical protein K2Y37_14280 [Pirellulales bacterium]|nr:hypothetical protein [Pirellulales bacterium]